MKAKRLLAWSVISAALYLWPGAQAEIVFPRALQSGDTIRFVAPAGRLDPASMERARERLEAVGFLVQIPDNLYRTESHDYLAGDDNARAAELMQAFADDEVDAIFPGTGGYGTTRLLDKLDYDKIRSHPKVFIGFSDLTALHVAIHQRTGLVTFHSPNPMWGLGSVDNLSAYSEHWFWRALRAPDIGQSVASETHGYAISAVIPGKATFNLNEACKLSAPKAMRSGIAKGRLMGGNLSLVAALMGTPFEMDFRNKIVFLEDIGEAPYRVDRMLSTLRLSGKLDQAAGFVLGTFTRRENEDTSDEVTTIDDVLEEYFSRLEVPVLWRFPVGHHRCNATLPIGALCELDADRAELKLLESPVARAVASLEGSTNR